MTTIAHTNHVRVSSSSHRAGLWLWYRRLPGHHASSTTTADKVGPPEEWRRRTRKHPAVSYMVGYSFGGSINSNSYVLFSFSRKLADDARRQSPKLKTESITNITPEQNQGLSVMCVWFLSNILFINVHLLVCWRWACWVFDCFTFFLLWLFAVILIRISQS